LQFIDPEQIERVEFIKGSRSALYGSDAIGGVLQIFTLSRPESLDGYVTGEIGSHNTKRVALGVKDSIDAFYYSVNVSQEESDGFDNTVDIAENNADDDPYEILSGNLGLGFEISDTMDLSFRHFQTKSEVDYDSQFAPGEKPFSNTDQSATSLLFKAKLNKRFSTKLSVGQSKDDSENLDRLDISIMPTYFNSNSENVFWVNTFSLRPQITLDFGADYLSESVESSTVYGENDRDNTGIFTQLSYKEDGYYAVFGVRQDDSSSYDVETTKNAAFGYIVNPALGFYISYGEGFKAPSFNDLYWPDSGFSAGNPDVLPESSVSYDFGIKGESSGLNYAFSVFKIDIDNLIDWAPDAEGVWRPSNVSSAELSGYELSVHKQFDAFKVESSVSYVDAIDVETRQTLTNRAKTNFSLNISREFGVNTLGVLVHAASKRKTSFDEPLSGYGTADIYFNSELTRALNLRLRVNNVLDREYQVNERFNEDGTNVNAKITYKF